MNFTSISFAVGSHEVDLATVSAMHPEWECEKVFSRTGVSTFNYSETDNPVDLAIEAFERIPAKDTADIDAVIFVTQTYTKRFPGPCIEFIRRANLNRRTYHIDYHAGCSGFALAVIMADALLKSGKSGKICIVTADVYSHHLSGNDRSTKLLFSDGASCAIVTPDPTWSIAKTSIGSIFEDHSSLEFPISNAGSTSHIYMHGSSVFQFARASFATIIKDCYPEGEETHLTDLFLVHQGSRAIIDELLFHHNINPKKMPTIFPKIGNITSSTLPALISMNFSDFNQAKDVLLAGFGVGLSFCGLRLFKNS
jgi:3-oxoacyl-[acyl-carrier-protein] synthase-3